MDNNLILNKPAQASNSFEPFSPSKAVNGNFSPEDRWVSSQLPVWLSVDLLSNYYISKWSARFMGDVGWQSPNYNMTDFKLQGSTDNVNWQDMDAITGNTASNITRNTTPKLVRYLRIYITKGLNCNNDASSIADFQAAEVAGAPFLSNLVPGAGTLNPAFSSRNLVYSMNVENGISSIAFTPTAVQTNMEIKVNNVVVQSGSQSQQITLSVGNNTIPITVKSADGTLLTTYTVVVNRAGVQVYLNSLVIKNNRNQDVALVPPFAKQTLSYTASQGAGTASVTITPTAEDSSATILVNGTSVPSGSTSAPISLQTGQNTITIVINSVTTYTILITKG
jgi:hypothetical protein